ncbi:MAG: hypothetical protein RXR43_08310 [Sulfolobus sp.]
MMTSHADVGKGGGDYGDVSSVPSKSHDPWAKSLHSIMNESVGRNCNTP